MKRATRSVSVVLGAGAVLAVAAPGAWAQTVINPSATPVENAAGAGPITPFGIHTSFAVLLGVLGLLVAVAITILYLRYAPRFAKDEESLKVVRADRVRLGEELPRRNVDLTQANPVLVAPPAIPSTVGAPSLPPATAAAPAPAAAPAAVVAAPAAPPAATTPAAPAASAPSAAPAERVEVSMDQEVFDQTLAELLAAGTDRRIAEGKAKRAGMIAAKKKAAGEG